MSLRTLSVAVAALFQLACPNPDPGFASQQRVIRTYDVPMGTGRDLRNALNGMTGAAGEKEPERGVAARAQVLPDGRVAVYGPERFHEGVKELVGKLASRPPPPLLSFRVWQVRGVPGTGVIPPSLQAIRPALEEVTKTVGPTDFSLVEPFLINVASGESAQAMGAEWQVKVEGTVLGDSVLAQLRLDATRGRHFDTTLQLPQGKTIVIGQTAEAAEKAGTSSSMIFSVVQASVAHVAAGGQ